MSHSSLVYTRLGIEKQLFRVSFRGKNEIIVVNSLLKINSFIAYVYTHTLLLVEGDKAITCVLTVLRFAPVKP